MWRLRYRRWSHGAAGKLVLCRGRTDLASRTRGSRRTSIRGFGRGRERWPQPLLTAQQAMPSMRVRAGRSEPGHRRPSGCRREAICRSDGGEARRGDREVAVCRTAAVSVPALPAGRRSSKRSAWAVKQLWAGTCFLDRCPQSVMEALRLRDVAGGHGAQDPLVWNTASRSAKKGSLATSWSQVSMTVSPRWSVKV